MPREASWFLGFATLLIAMLYLLHRRHRPVRRRARGAKIVPFPRQPWQRARTRIRRSG